MIKLRSIPMEYQDRAPTECYDNTTDSIQLYIILAKRIQANNNQTITEMDLTRFGDGVVEQYGLKESACKNFLIFIGVEVAKMAYVRTGSDLKLPPKLMEQIFNQYNLFKAKNFTEVLNKIIDEIGEKISDPNQVTISNGTKTETDELIHNLLSINETTVAQNSSNSDTLAIIYNPAQQPTSWWMIAMSIITLCLAVITLFFLLSTVKHNRQIRKMHTSHHACNCQCQNTSTEANTTKNQPDDETIRQSTSDPVINEPKKKLTLFFNKLSRTI